MLWTGMMAYAGFLGLGVDSQKGKRWDGQQVATTRARGHRPGLVWMDTLDTE